MRISDILYEVKMSPSSLSKEAAGIDALVGIEFEMLVPYDPAEFSQGLGNDANITDLKSVLKFFISGSSPNPKELVLDVLEDLLETYYVPWLKERAKSELAADRADQLLTDRSKKLLDLAVAIASNRAGKDVDEDSREVEEELNKLVDYETSTWVERNPRAVTAWIDDNYKKYINTWLAASEFNTMGQIYALYHKELTWPHLNDDPELVFKTVAQDFQQHTGLSTTWGSTVDRSNRHANKYTLEPDASIEPDSGDDRSLGLEFISPPLSLNRMIEDLQKVKAWADHRGCYTNSSTGLHINISLPGRDFSNIDQLKLALLIGDKHVLQQYQREFNAHAQSVVRKLERVVSDLTQDEVKEILQKLKTGATSAAADSLSYVLKPEKYTSIHPHQGRVEFRSPGGDWLSTNFDKIVDTMTRFVVALDAAARPEAYRKEYLKKLYALFMPGKSKSAV